MSLLINIPSGQLDLASVSPDHEITKAKYEAIGKSEVIKSASGDQYNVASLCLRDLAGIRRSVENSRKEVKEPVLRLGRAIDKAAADFLEQVVNEEKRITGLIAAEDAERLRKQREAEGNARRLREEIERKAREDAEQIRREAEEQERKIREANAKQVVDLDEAEEAIRKAEEQKRAADEEARRIQAEAAEKARNVTQYCAPKPTAHAAREVWDFEVLSAEAIAAHRLDLVTITPKRQAILDALEAGQTVPGIRAFKRVAIRAGGGR